MSTSSSIVRTLGFDKETKNTYRFTEMRAIGEPEVLGTLYVRRDQVPEGTAGIKVTLEFVAAPENN